MSKDLTKKEDAISYFDDAMFDLGQFADKIVLKRCREAALAGPVDSDDVDGFILDAVKRWVILKAGPNAGVIVGISSCPHNCTDGNCPFDRAVADEKKKLTDGE